MSMSHDEKEVRRRKYWKGLVSEKSLQTGEPCVIIKHIEDDESIKKLSEVIAQQRLTPLIKGMSDTDEYAIYF